MTGDESDGFEEEPFEEEPLDEHETALVEQDLLDLTDFEATFRPEGYRGMAVWCEDCAEEHFYPWDMLRENLRLLLETGEIPVHEPAFAPEPDRYIPWEYARGYVEALRDVGADARREVDACPRCGLELTGMAREGNFCPRCGATLLVPRLEDALRELGLQEAQVADVLRAVGFPSLPPLDE